jgi:protoporphyrinogen oxidase
VASVGIVGGGVLGLTLAFRLAREGHEVTILEGASAPGGLVAPQQIGGFVWDRFYHVILLSDSQLRGLLEELELDHLLHWGITRTGFYTDGELYSLSSSWDFLRFPPLGLIDKARLAATILRASRIRDSRKLEAIPVTTWLERWSGKRTVERIWLPLLRSKLGDNYRFASAAFIWTNIARLYAARRTGLKQEMFGYVEGGYHTILQRFQEHVQKLGVQIECGAMVAEVTDQQDSASIRLRNGETFSFDHVVLTVPSSYIAALCPQLDEQEKNRLRGIVYQGVTCASLLLRRPLAGFYVTNITESWVPFTAVVEMTSLVDRASFGGHTLVYLPRYLTQDDPFWQRSDADIEEEFITALERMYPGFRRRDVLVFQVARARVMQAISTLHYSDRWLPPMRTSLPGVSIVNTSQIANGTLNVNETVGLANEKAAELLPYLRAGRSAARREESWV